MLPQITREAGRRFGEATAYITPDRWALSYADIDRISDAVAAGLHDRGLSEGSVLALVLPPGPEYLIAYLAAAKIGAITTGVNDRLTQPERDAVLAIAEPALVLTAPGHEPSDPSLHVEEAEPATDAEGLLAQLRSETIVTDLAPDPDRPVAIIFTSGTTGLPKGALYTNRQFDFITTTDVGDAWGGGTRSYVGTSFAHLGFMTKLPGNLRRGGTSFMSRRWQAREALALVARERMAMVGGVPTQLALMLADPTFDDFDLSSVSYIVVGGGPITPGLAAEARRRFGAALATRYSCTEAGIGLGTAFHDPEEDAIVSVGRPHAAIDLAVLDPDDQPVASGEVGAVCLRSPAVMHSYWNNPEGTRAAFTDTGHVRTGDLGWIDDRGRLRLVGRSKEMYIRGGYNVYPVEVEAVLSMHSDVQAIAIAPRPDPVMGEVGVAVVVPRAGATVTLAGLRDFASDRLSHYKLPEALSLVESLPLTAGEKVDRFALEHLVRETSAAPRPR